MIIFIFFGFPPLAIGFALLMRAGGYFRP